MTTAPAVENIPSKASALEGIPISARLTAEERDAAPELRRLLPGMDMIPWRSLKILQENASIADLVGKWFPEFATQTTEIEYEIVLGVKQDAYRDVFESLVDLSRPQPGKGHCDNVIEYMLRMILIDRYLWRFDWDAAPKKEKRELSRPSSCQSAFRIDSFKGLMQKLRATFSSSKESKGDDPKLLGKGKRVSLPENAPVESHRTSQTPALRSSGHFVPSKHYLTQLVGLGRIYQTATRTKIEENIAIAAFYVAYLFSGAKDFKMFLTRIEEDLSQVYDNQPDKSFTISALKLLNRATIQPKRPLLYAAFISPLALLVPQKLASKPAKQYLAWDMLQDGCTLGSPQVHSLSDVERKMWDVIFKVASGEVTLQLGVEDLVKSLPYSEIDALSDSEDQALRFCENMPIEAAGTTEAVADKDEPTNVDDTNHPFLQIVTIKQLLPPVAPTGSVVIVVSPESAHIVPHSCPYVEQLRIDNNPEGNTTALAPVSVTLSTEETKGEPGNDENNIAESSGAPEATQPIVGPTMYNDEGVGESTSPRSDPKGGGIGETNSPSDEHLAALSHAIDNMSQSIEVQVGSGDSDMGVEAADVDGGEGVNVMLVDYPDDLSDADAEGVDLMPVDHPGDLSEADGGEGVDKSNVPGANSPATEYLALNAMSVNCTEELDRAVSLSQDNDGELFDVPGNGVEESTGPQVLGTMTVNDLMGNHAGGGGECENVAVEGSSQNSQLATAPPAFAHMAVNLLSGHHSTVLSDAADEAANMHDGTSSNLPTAECHAERAGGSEGTWLEKSMVAPITQAVAKPSVLDDMFVSGCTEQTHWNAVILDQDEMNELGVWSIYHVCDKALKLPTTSNVTHRVNKDWTYFSSDSPTVSLSDLFKHEKPASSTVMSLADLAPAALLAGSQSVCLPGYADVRFPLKAIGAWQICHKAPTARSVWSAANLWVRNKKKAGRISSKEAEDYEQLTLLVSWASSTKGLYNVQPFTELTVLLSESMINDVVIDAMLSLLVLYLRRQPVAQDALYGIAHTSFGQALSQLVASRRLDYPKRGHSLLLQAGSVLERHNCVRLYGVTNTLTAHWAAFCVSKSDSKVVIGWADPLGWKMPAPFLKALNIWLDYHCAGLSVEVDDRMLACGIQKDMFSCGIIAVNSLKHHFLARSLWSPSRCSSIRLSEFVEIVQESEYAIHDQCGMSKVLHWFTKDTGVPVHTELDGPTTLFHPLSPRQELIEDAKSPEHSPEHISDTAPITIDLSPFPPMDTDNDNESLSTKGKKRQRSLSSSSDESMASKGSSQLQADPPTMAPAVHNPSVTVPRRSDRPKKPLAGDEAMPPQNSTRPPPKRRKPTKPASKTSSNSLADRAVADEKEDVKPRLWLPQNVWEETVSCLPEYMAEDLPPQKALQRKDDDDSKTWLDIALMDNTAVVETKVFSLFTVNGEARDFTFRFTDADDATLFSQLMDMAEKNYVKGLPRYLSEPESSAFRVFNNAELPTLTPMDLLSTFERQAIVIKDYPCYHVPWTPEGMAKFGFLNKQQTIYDLSKPKVRVDNQGVMRTIRRDHSGTLWRLYDCSLLPNPKPLLSLDNHMPVGPHWHDGAKAIATDLLGFNSMLRHPEGPSVREPIDDRVWTLFSTAGAWSLTHIDADGAATLVQPCHGTKLWFLIRGSGYHSPHNFAWPEQFNPPWALDRAEFDSFLKDHTCRHLLTVEVMVLEEDMQLLMPPNTPHAVLSPTNSIFQGGHFYALTTMRDTHAGLVHMLTQERYITNTSHPPLRMMIRKVVAYVHANVFPAKYDRLDRSQCFDPTQLDNQTMIYLFSVISLGFLSNVLDPRTYRIRQDDTLPTDEEKAIHEQYDFNAMPPSDRRGCIWTRGMAVELVDWFCAHYDLKPHNRQQNMDTITLLRDAIAQEAFAVYFASTVVESVPDREDMCAYGATSANIRYQLEHLDNDAFVQEQIDYQLKKFDEGKTRKNFNILYDWSDWTCVPKPSGKFKQMAEREIFQWGCTSLDMAYIEGEGCEFKPETVV